MSQQPSRRTVLKSVGVIGCAAGGGVVLSGCGGGSAEPAAKTFAPVDLDVSGLGVGEGQLFKEQSVFVTQPAAGEFHAFNAVCPHEGCAVTAIREEKIFCPCHASVFDTTSGERLSGPARTGLQPLKATVKGTTLTVSS